MERGGVLSGRCGEGPLGGVLSGRCPLGGVRANWEVGAKWEVWR